MTRPAAAASASVWRRFAAETWTPPFAAQIPSNAEVYAAHASVRKIVLRRMRRLAWLTLNGQLGRERSGIEPARDRRILWIHAGMPQVGDSLMDLAGRVLLAGRVERLDLLTDPHLAALYVDDDVFAHVYNDPAEAAANDYDLVMVLCASSQSLGEKLRWFRRLPFVNLQRWYTGPEFHRTLFGLHRLDQLLGLHLGAAALERLARPHMVVGQPVRDAVDALDLPPRFIAIALGGVRDWRTYAHWADVVAALDAAGDVTPVVLLGSANGGAARDAVLAARPRRDVLDLVDRHSLPVVFEIVRRAAVVACADGGLMHIAHAAGTPSVELYAERIEPRFRLVSDDRAIAFHAPLRVSEVAPAFVAEAIVRVVSKGVAGVTIRRL